MSKVTHPKLTAILIGIATTAAILAVPGLQFAHANPNGVENCGVNGAIGSCDANGAAPGHGGLIPGQSVGASNNGEVSNVTPHSCTLGMC